VNPAINGWAIVKDGKDAQLLHVHGSSRTTKPRPARQSGSLSGNAQMSRRRLAMTRQASLKPASLKIAQPFMAGLNVINIKSSPVRDGRTFLSSLTGLETSPNREPSHKWLGYCQRWERCAASPRPWQFADDEAASDAPERFAFRQRANVAQAFGHDAAGFAENSPAIYGWVKRHQHKIKSRQGRQNISFVPHGTCDVSEP
jgi:hypothetical protein